MDTKFSYSGTYLEELSEAMFLTTGYICEKYQHCDSCPLNKVCDEIERIYDATRTAYKLVITVSSEK